MQVPYAIPSFLSSLCELKFSTFLSHSKLSTCTKTFSLTAFSEKQHWLTNIFICTDALQCCSRAGRYKGQADEQVHSSFQAFASTSSHRNAHKSIEPHPQVLYSLPLSCASACIGQWGNALMIGWESIFISCQSPRFVCLQFIATDMGARLSFRMLTLLLEPSKS